MVVVVESRQTTGTTIQRIARWSGLLHGILALILGIYHAAHRHAHIRWPEGGWTDDVNAGRWRQRMFSLDPDIFLDLWTPIVFGLVAIFMHFRHFHIRSISDSFIRYFIFHFIMTMVGVIGYSGGLGIIFSIVGFFTCLMALLAYFIEDDRADMCLREDIWNGLRQDYTLSEPRITGVRTTAAAPAAVPETK